MSIIALLVSFDLDTNINGTVAVISVAIAIVVFRTIALILTRRR